MKKLLVSDYDDTFYINDDDIFNNVKLVNKYKNKIMFMIATGRSYYDYQKKQNKYNIESNYVILNHGATLLKNDQIIFDIFIDENLKNNLIKDLRLKETINYFGCSGKESRLDLKENNLTKINVKYNCMETALKVYEYITDKYGDYINCFLVSHCTAIEIVDKKSDKKNAILKVIELENIIKENVYTIGNGDTDYEMLNYFNGYAMEKSSLSIDSLNLDKVNSVSELIKNLVE